MFFSIINLLVAFFRAFPPLTEVVECALDVCESANVSEAITRKQKKDKTVNEAINGNRSTGAS